MRRADPHIGLLHRGTEKLIEYKTYIQVYNFKQQQQKIQNKLNKKLLFFQQQQKKTKRRCPISIVSIT